MMITKCYFDDDNFIERNGRTMSVSDDIGDKNLNDVKIEIIKDGSRESVVVVNGRELMKAIKNCTGINEPWGEF